MEEGVGSVCGGRGEVYIKDKCNSACLPTPLTQNKLLHLMTIRWKDWISWHIMQPIISFCLVWTLTFVWKMQAILFPFSQALWKHIKTWSILRSLQCNLNVKRKKHTHTQPAYRFTAERGNEHRSIAVIRNKITFWWPEEMRSIRPSDIDSSPPSFLVFLECLQKNRKKDNGGNTYTSAKP